MRACTRSLVFVSFLLVIGCSGESTAPTTAPEPSIVGAWASIGKEAGFVFLEDGRAFAFPKGLWDDDRDEMKYGLADGNLSLVATKRRRFGQPSVRQEVVMAIDLSPGEFVLRELSPSGVPMVAEARFQRLDVDPADFKGQRWVTGKYSIEFGVDGFLRRGWEESKIPYEQFGALVTWTEPGGELDAYIYVVEKDVETAPGRRDTLLTEATLRPQLPETWRHCSDAIGDAERSACSAFSERADQ